MTDPEPSDSIPGRIDLRTLDAADDAARTDVAIQRVLARIAGNAGAGFAELRVLRRMLRRMAIAAAILVALALATVIRASAQGQTSQDADPAIIWAVSGRDPSNAELLSVYHGYYP